eukprot:13801719-Alexandrium_andersonii.AAC.1
MDLPGAPNRLVQPDHQRLPPEALRPRPRRHQVPPVARRPATGCPLGPHLRAEHTGRRCLPGRIRGVL